MRSDTYVHLYICIIYITHRDRVLLGNVGFEGYRCRWQTPQKPRPGLQVSIELGHAQRLCRSLVARALRKAFRFRVGSVEWSLNDGEVHSRKRTWKPKRLPIKTTVP